MFDSVLSPEENYVVAFFDNLPLMPKEKKSDFDCKIFTLGLEKLATRKNYRPPDNWNFRFLSEYANTTEVAAIYAKALPLLLGQILEQYRPNFVENFSNAREKYGLVDQISFKACVTYSIAEKRMNGVIAAIQSYNIIDEATLIETAKLAAQKELYFFHYIKNFRIKNQKALIEIAKINLKNNINNLSDIITKYGIKDQADLIDFAKFAVQQDTGRYASAQIKEYDIKNQADLIDIAKCAAQHDGEGTSHWIAQYGISSQSALREIAEIAIEQDIQAFAYLKNYGITSNSELVEIAKTTAKQYGNAIVLLWATTNRCMKSDNKHNSYAFLEQPEYENTGKKLGLIALGTEASVALSSILKLKTKNYYDGGNCDFIKMYLPSASDRIAQPFMRLASDESVEDFNAEATQLIALGEQLGLDRQNLTKIVESLQFKDDKKEQPLSLHVVRENLIWLLQSLGRLSHHDNLLPLDTLMIPAARRKAVEEALGKCAKIHNPQLRHKLIALSWKTLDHEVAAAFFHNQNEGKQKQPQFFFFQLASACLLYKNLSEKEIVKGILEPLYALNKELKNKALYEPLYNLIYIWSQDNALKAEDILFMAEYIFRLQKSQTNQLIERLKLLITLANLTTAGDLQKELLQDFVQNDDSESQKLNEYFAQLFVQKVPVQRRNDLRQRLEERFFSQQRQGSALLRYVSTLHTLPINERPLALKALADYIDHALLSPQEFSLWRLNQEHNLHLQTIFSNYPDLEAKWNIEVERPLNDYLPKAADANQQNGFDIHNYLHTQLNSHKHKFLPQLQAYLQSSDETLKKQIYDQLCTDTEENSEEQAQKLLIECTKSDFTHKSLQDKLSQIRQIEHLLHLPHNDPFAEDLKVIKNAMKPVKESNQNYRLLITDNYYDLLLCGTEVEGSCQRVDGVASLNKGLLGYLTHGQDRLLLIKDSDGKICGRAILRLAWDAKEQKPVLFLASIYPANITSEWEKAMVQMACEHAETLGLPLLSQQVGKGERYPNNIKGLGGPAAFEYIDEKGGIAAHAIYTVNRVHYLHKPV